eukprot:scaffold255951_cov26-Prasinocladus_malaysianus.AAC.1
MEQHFIPAAVPGGWIPWGAQAVADAMMLSAPQLAQHHATGQTTDNHTAAGEVASPPRGQTKQKEAARPAPPSPEASSVDDYSMSFEKEEMGEAL